MQNWALAVVLALLLTGEEVQSQKQVIPNQISQVNGSSAQMGCVGNSSRDGMELCDCSYLTDGTTPDVDVARANWASQLVTIRRREGNEVIPNPHVLLTFYFETGVPIDEIKIYLMNCPEWNIGVTGIQVYLYSSYEPTFIVDDRLRFANLNGIIWETCASLSIGTLSPPEEVDYSTVFIVFIMDDPNKEWVHIGEVEFKYGNNDAPIPCSESSPNFTISPDTTLSPTTLSPTYTTTTYISICQNSSEDNCINVSSIIPEHSSTPGFTINNPTPEINIKTETGGTNPAPAIIGFSITVPLLLCIIATILILIVVSILVKYRHKKNEITSDDDLGEWQNGSALHNSDEEKVGSIDQMHMNYDVPRSALAQVEPPNYDDLQPPKYNPSFTNNHVDLSDGVYDQVTTDEFGELSDEGEYDDVEALKVARKPSAPELSVEIPNSQNSTHLYTHVNKNHPRVPQKSKDLVKYLATRKGGGVRHDSVSSRSQLAYNPVYDSGDAVAQEVKKYIESANGEEMYAQPTAHPAVTLGATNGTERATTPEPSAPVINEPIQPSHFTRGYDESEESEDPHIYSPIYAIPTPIPNVSKPAVITNNNIVEKKELGMGQFGRVVLAATNSLSLKDMKMSDTEDNKNISILVAVKRLAVQPSKEDRRIFEKEVQLMSALKHTNVVSLLGVCYQDPAFIMMEYMEEGDLNHFLKRYTEIVPIITTSNRIQITTSTLVYMVSQIASAMSYLASHNYIHRDLASRNCLVGANFVVKIADFGMSRSLYQSHYYRIQGNAILPIRWMATESFFGIFSEKTDVWSFGVTMWELFTLAKEDPYSMFTDTQLVEDAIKGVNRRLLDKPPFCPSSLYKIMLQCWVIDPKGRATFRAIDEMLQLYWGTPESAV